MILLCLASSTTPRRQNLLVALAQYTVTHFRSSSTKSSSWFLSSLTSKFLRSVINLLMSVRLPETAVNAFVRCCFSRRIFSSSPFFPLIFGSFEILHYRYRSFWRFPFPFRFESFQVFFFDILQNVMGEFRSFIAVCERDVDTFAQCSFV